MSTLRVVGLDLSLTSSGLAFLSTGDGDIELRSKSVKSATAGYDLVKRSHRLGTMTDKIVADVLAFKPQLAVIESPAPNQKSGQHHDRSGLWWLVANILISDGWPVMEVSTTTLKKYASGSGNANKLDVAIAVTKRYAWCDFKTDDEADAIVLAAIGARLHGHPIEASLPKSQLDAMKPLTPLEIINA